MVGAEVIDGLTPALVKLHGVFGNPRPAFRPMVELGVKFTREDFDTQGRAGGRPWAPRKASTLRAVTSANRGGFSKVGLPGRASDRMYLSLATFGGPDSFYEETDSSVTWGSRVRSRGGFPYPLAFHRGTGRQPARPVVTFTERRVREMARVGRKSFRERIEPLGFDYSDSSEAAF